MPKKLDWYVLTEVTAPFLGGIIFFNFVFLMFQILRLADFFIVHGVSGWLLTKMTLLMVLTFMPMVLPVAFLIGVLIAFGRLSADSELIALKASGISILRMAAPILVLASGVAALSLILNLEWVPLGDHAFKNILFRVSNTKIVSSLKEGTFNTGFFDLLIFTDKFDSRHNRLHRVFIYDEREPSNPVAIVAQEGEIVSVKPSSDLGAAAVLKLFNGNIHRNEAAADSYQKIDFGEYRLFLKVEEGVDTGTVKPRMIPYRDLMKSINELTPGSLYHREFRAELWRRFSVALSPLIFVFLGIGYGTVRTRAVKVGAALVAFVIILLYWAIQAAGTVLASDGRLNPVFAMLLPNFILILIAIRGFISAFW